MEFCLEFEIKIIRGKRGTSLEKCNIYVLTHLTRIILYRRQIFLHLKYKLQIQHLIVMNKLPRMENSSAQLTNTYFQYENKNHIAKKRTIFKQA